jgi:hypothetical protein
MRRILLGALLLTACGPDRIHGDPPPTPIPDLGPDFPDEGPFGFPSGPPPQFGQTVTQVNPPPPISGGTLAALSDGTTAVASDPDRDQIYVVDLGKPQVVTTFTLNGGDEPGRVIEDAAGRAHVVLRGGGALVTLTKGTTGWTIARRAVCAAPRGVAYQATGDLVHVACAGGELVSLPAAGGAATRTLVLEPDLRDVIVDGAILRISKFRNAELLSVDATGQITSRSRADGGDHSPSIAWRTIAKPGGGAIMIHQLAFDGTVIPQPGGYGGPNPCEGVVTPAVTIFQDGVTPLASMMPGPVLAVDAALTADGSKLYIVSPGNAHTPGLPTVVTLYLSDVIGTCGASGGEVVADGEPTAVATLKNGGFLVQSREPALLEVFATDGSGFVSIALSSVPRNDTGHAIFHANAGSSIACASCHAEGGEDGRIWNFAGEGARRTQSLRGGLSGTEPFHWNGDMPNLSTLMTNVFTGRMSGPVLASDQVQALGHFLDGIPAISASPGDAAAIARGQTLFFNDGGCSGCHNGAHYTNNDSVDVGTDGTFQVPRLTNLWAHPPYLHDGRAATLADRFGPNGGANHGNTRSLTPSQISDLVSFLGSL